MTEERYYSSRHEDGSWQVFDRESTKTYWNATYWDARWEADHLNGKHEAKAHAKCHRCKEA